MYDFGDKFLHAIQVSPPSYLTGRLLAHSFVRRYKLEKIVPEDQSDGQVRILDGRGMCPGGKLAVLTKFGFRQCSRLISDISVSLCSENMNGNFIFRDDVLSVIDSGNENAKSVALSDMCLLV